MKTVYALIDCNNFFVSCERLFRPDLASRPVVVLSSNDGCVIARSNEVKALGISMGAPAFKYRQFFQAKEVVCFSANFELYSDISARITRLLSTAAPRIEVYSIDESFLDLSQLGLRDYESWGRAMRARLQREVGIPVSIGIASSKTLAKLSAEHAKQQPELAGVLDLITASPQKQLTYLQQTPIADVWGVGYRLAPKFRAEGLQTALDLSQLHSRLAGQLMGVHGRQLVAELNGTSCHTVAPATKPRQSVMHGRMFGADTNQLSVLEAAIAHLTARASFCLHKEHLLACTAVVSLSTNRHKPGYQHLIKTVRLPLPTADPGVITAQLLNAITPFFNPDSLYHRANVLLHDLISRDAFQVDLFDTSAIDCQIASQARLEAISCLNERYGQGTVYYAAEGLSRAWEPKHAHRSPRYTTNWEELPIVRLLSHVKD